MSQKKTKTVMVKLCLFLQILLKVVRNEDFSTHRSYPNLDGQWLPDSIRFVSFWFSHFNRFTVRVILDILLLLVHVIFMRSEKCKIFLIS